MAVDQTKMSPPQVVDNDEIDLFELASNLWKEKKIIAIVTGVVTIVALLYALFASPVYQARTVLKPVTTKNLDALNVSGIYSLTPKAALAQVGEQLASYNLRYQFFLDHLELFGVKDPEKEDLEQVFRQFDNQNVKLEVPKDKEDLALANSLILQINYPKTMNGVAIINGLVNAATQAERENIKETMSVVIDNQIQKLSDDIEVARAGYFANKESKIAQLEEKTILDRQVLLDELAALKETLKKQRLNRIEQLNEAIKIASDLGIVKPTKSTAFGGSGDISIDGNIIRTEVSNNHDPLYFMGTEVLTAERDQLLARKSDDFTSGRILEIEQQLKLLEHNRQAEILAMRKNDDLFLAELAENRKKVAQLKGIRVNFDRVKIVDVDEPAIKPLKPIKPKKSLIVVIGFLLGGMIGVGVALVRIVVRNRRESSHQA
ncbi:Wzz/FepE/Etk N-terminal domain-containing protein [Ignatzschineria larvae DSM 13226]|uniref:Wzz/FepE/Etk N-terminal domain-containing protein n=1 Tax=Ignatzschineria larvae DSM 13226 TaxID=1111732 RepID=A0ABZ3C0L3_9GAMM|nr:Wzz/FepE/Etk N-terminal domain-containing protein [Ignatzschineria larvae]